MERARRWCAQRREAEWDILLRDPANLCGVGGPGGHPLASSSLRTSCAQTRRRTLSKPSSRKAMEHQTQANTMSEQESSDTLMECSRGFHVQAKPSREIAAKQLPHSALTGRGCVPS